MGAYHKMIVEGGIRQGEAGLGKRQAALNESWPYPSQSIEW